MYFDFVAVEHTAHRTGDGAAEPALTFPKGSHRSRVIRWLASCRICWHGASPNARSRRGCTSEACELAVLGLDISESTSIIEDAVKWSPDGSERIARALNTVFTLLSEVITEHGGSVTTLAGDESWPCGPSQSRAILPCPPCGLPARQWLFRRRRAI